MTFVRTALVLFSIAALPLGVALAEQRVSPDDATKHLLRYRFSPGEVIRSKVTHQAAVRTTIDGSTQKAETVSISVKAWKVTDVDAKGQITFVHSVEYVDMKNDVTGRETARYDSRKDEQPPNQFKDVAKRIGVPLTEIVIDPAGKILRREDKAPGSPAPTQITMPLPAESVAVGESWTFPSDIKVKLRSGAIKTVKTRQRFELKAVEDGIAKIHIATQILSPLQSKEVEAQVIQRASEGTIQFDIDAGRVIAQQIDLDRRVVGYPNAKSSMHYRTRFTERLLKPGERTAAK